MKTLVTIAAIAFSAVSFNAWSQAGDKKEKELDKTQENERERSTQGLRTDNELKDDRGEVQSNQYRKSGENSNADTTSSGSQANDEVIEPNTDQGLGTDDDGNGLTNENNTTQGGEKNNNTPAVIQRTSSESGSPAVLSGNNGKERDGTNNVQRATPNMAGAKEPGNLNLSKKNTESKNQNTGTETKIRKEEEVPARVRDNRSKINKVENDTLGNADKAMQQPKQDQQSGELKENVASEPEQTSLSPKEERKAKRKERRNRRKD